MMLMRILLTKCVNVREQYCSSSVWRQKVTVLSIDIDPFASKLTSCKSVEWCDKDTKGD